MIPGAAGSLARTAAALQAELEAIVGVVAPRVGPFLLGREVAEAAGHAPRAPEELLVQEDGEALWIGLFLDEALADGAARGLLRPLAFAAEGVSHFVYLASRAERGRPVSLLELEVQAEVDVFALLLLRLWRHGRRALSRALRHRLFEAVHFRSHLDVEERGRYREACRLGGGYARWLEGRFVGRADAEGLVRELRQSYRLGAGEKLGYLGARAMQ
jgi:hypothetical protein